MKVAPPLQPGVVELDRELLLQNYPLPHHPEDSNKGDRGLILVIAGSRELSGAALLAGVGALRAGAGILQIATATSIAVHLGVAVPEARVIGLEETNGGCLAETAVQPVIELAAGAQAILIGCGMQNGPSFDRMLDAILTSGLNTPLVLDAAALGSTAPRAEALRRWKGGAALLPHAGEAARLLECHPEDVSAHPLMAAQAAATRFHAVALVKGQHSHIVAPDGRAFRFRGGGVGLATSGSGDTLAGIVGGLCARGADPLTAVLWGVYLHGEAGRVLSKEVGRVGFLAREIPDQIPKLLENHSH